MMSEKMSQNDYEEYQEFLRFKEMKRQQAQVQQSVNATKYCKYCGAVIDGMSQVCPICGKQLNGLNSNMSVKSVDSVEEQWIYEKEDVPFILLSIVPLLGIVLSWLGLSTTAEVIIVIICNSILLAADIDLIRKSGHFSKEWWLYTGFFFVPVYMFIRISKTTKQYWPAIVWCCCFFLDLVL